MISNPWPLRWSGGRSAAGMVACLALLIAHAARAESLILLTEEKPPRQMTLHGKITGSVVEEVRFLMEDAGVDYDLQIMPWARAYALARARANTCVFNTARTSEREPYFRWIGPLSSQRWALYARTGSGMKIAKLEDARKYRIGTYNQDVRDAYLRKLGFHVDAAPSDLNNVAKLIVGHIDLWAEDEQVATELLEKSGHTGLVEPVFVFKKLEGFLACNRGSSAAIIDRLEMSFAKPGTAKRFLEIRQQFEKSNR